MNDTASQNQKVIKIGKPERVNRILARVFNAKMEVLIRSKQNLSVAVRARAKFFDESDGLPNLSFSEISEQGMRYLSYVSDVRVEIVGMSTQILFFARKLSHDATTVTLAVPNELMSYDRRENLRVQIANKDAAFMTFSQWNAAANQSTSPPVISLYSNLSSYILLADISEGGACGLARFPGAIDDLERGSLDHRSALHLPMRAPITIPTEIRWTRRIKENKTFKNETRHQRFYRIGIQFQSLDEETRLVIKQYMQKLSVSDAI